jgi:hypothetical protein
VVSVFKAEHQDACLGEFEADTAESVLGVIGAERSVRKRHGHRVGLEVLGLAQFLVLIDLTITAMHYVSGHLPHLHFDAPGPTHFDGIPGAAVPPAPVGSVTALPATPEPPSRATDGVSSSAELELRPQEILSAHTDDSVGVLGGQAEVAQWVDLPTLDAKRVEDDYHRTARGGVDGTGCRSS